MFKVSRTRFMYYTTQRSLPSKYRPSRVLRVDKTASPISYYSYLREFPVFDEPFTVVSVQNRRHFLKRLPRVES